MTEREHRKALKREQYARCQNPKCAQRFRLGSNPDQKYCRASCYKIHRRQKSQEGDK